MAFQTAGALALQGGRGRRGTVDLLEPVDEVDVLVADEYVGAVMSDLSGRRGRVLGTEPVGDRPHRSSGPRCPQVEITRYAIDLRSMTHGTGTFTRRFARLRADAQPPRGQPAPRRLTAAGPVRRMS